MQIVTYWYVMHRTEWLVSFMHYDLGYFDHQTCRLEPIENPFAARVLPMSPVLRCKPCDQNTPFCVWRARRDWTAASLPRRRDAAPPVVALRAPRCELPTTWFEVMHSISNE
jgi:hypothetical protein